MAFPRAFYALLALPGCQDVARSLVLYEKSHTYWSQMITSITVFQPKQIGSGSTANKGYWNMTDWPALLLHITKFDEVERGKARKLEKRYCLGKSDYVDELPNIKCDPIGDN